MKLEDIYDILKAVVPGKAFYGTNVYDNEDNASMPYVVYQEVGKRAIGYHDDRPIKYEQTVQITLVTETKCKSLEQDLERALTNNNLNYSLSAETLNGDRSVNRVYEIRIMEEN